MRTQFPLILIKFYIDISKLYSSFLTQYVSLAVFKGRVHRKISGLLNIRLLKLFLERKPQILSSTKKCAVVFFWITLYYF